ncbi:MAG: hypothetical protein HFE86_09455 [Clostridiales bacterium]|nr:hypothetical protein [Clostridiales bacterium]
MKKCILRSLGAIILSAALCMSTGMTAAAETVEPPIEEWTNDNAIVVDVKEEYVEEVLADPKGAFAELNPTGAYVYSLRKWGAEEMELLLVLPESGEQAQQESMEALADDIRVSDVRKCIEAPFEDVNTLQLTAESNTIHVGEKVVIRPTGKLKIYSPEYTPSDLYIIPTDFDKKDFTLKDFPSLPVKDILDMYPHYLHLTLATNDPGYFYYMDVVNNLASSPDIFGVWFQAPPAGRRTAEFCMVSEPSIAQFTNVREESYADNELVGIVNENKEYVLEGLAPGKVTVTYYNHAFDGNRYTAQMDITVLPNNDLTSDTRSESNTLDNTSTSNANGNDSSKVSAVSNRTESNNPKTGDAYPVAFVGLFVLAGIGVLRAIICRKRIRSIF